MKPYILGNANISLNNINQHQNEYPIYKNGIKLSDSSKILIFGFNEKSNENPTIGIKGKDYSIGDDMYIVKSINKHNLEKASNNSDLSSELKSKYYDVKCDDYDNILFRPCENMSLDDFLNDIGNQLDNEDDIDKIKYNQKFKFLPQCEKYVNEETLYKSKNLSCLTKSQKEQLIEEKREGEWIYKAPEIKVRTLSKNLEIQIYINLIIF